MSQSQLEIELTISVQLWMDEAHVTSTGKQIHEQAAGEHYEIIMFENM